jgi:MFS family permease
MASRSSRVGARHRDPIAGLFLARGLRDFGDGYISVVLPVYLTALGFSAVEVGVLATAALLGSALLTLSIGYFAARHDLRRLLLVGAVLMMATGLAFAVVDSYALLLVIAFAGTINPSAGSFSAFAPLEHAVLTREATDLERTRMFARYGFIGALAAAAGSLFAATPDLLDAIGIGETPAIKALFVLYTLLGATGALLYARLPVLPRPPAQQTRVLGPSRHVVYRLAVLFSLDAFAGGFMVQSMLALWLLERFGLSLSAASVFFFWSGVLGAFSFPVAAWLSRRAGLVNTMAWTQIPSNLCLIAAAVVPNLALVLVFLLIRAALTQMDVPARSSYVMAVVTEPERPAAASVTTVSRSLAAAISPALAGGGFTAAIAWPLIICGALKILYDVLLLIGFRHRKPPEEAA